MDLQDLLAGINSGQVDVTTSHAVKRVQKPRPSKPREQTDLQKRLRGQAGAVNSGAATAAAGPGPGPATAAATQPAPKPARAAGSGSSAARRATPPPPPTASGNAGTGAGVSLSVGAAAAPAGTAGAAAGAVSEGPVTQRLKKVLDMMKLNRETFTFEELKARIGLDLADDIELQEQLSVHTHITFDSIGQCLRYRPKTPGINNAKDLVNYLRRRTTVEGSSAQASMQGVRVSEIDDSYIGLADDIKQLQAQGIIHVFGTTQAGDEALFAVESMGFVPIAVPVVEQVARSCMGGCACVCVGACIHLMSACMAIMAHCAML